MRRVRPYLILFIFVLSLLGALFYSLCITRPIVGLTGISRKMAALDFNWRCPDTRKDEIGVLSRNLNELSDRLKAALLDLKEANASLQMRPAPSWKSRTAALTSRRNRFPAFSLPPLSAAGKYVQCLNGAAALVLSIRRENRNRN